MKYAFPSRYEDPDAMKLLNEWPRPQHGPLVQIAAPSHAAEQPSLQEVSGD